MNKVNGYCQIELPDRITLSNLKTAGVTLTKAEAKQIIDKLGLGGVKLPETTEERNRDAIYKQVKDALIRKPAYVTIKSWPEDGLTILPAFIVDEIASQTIIRIVALANNNYGAEVITILSQFPDLDDAEEIPTIYDLPFSVMAHQITTTQIQ